MTNYCSLLSIVYMIAFVAVFDRIHLRRFITRFCAHSLLQADEMDQIRLILTACQDGA